MTEGGFDFSPRHISGSPRPWPGSGLGEGAISSYGKPENNKLQIFLDLIKLVKTK
jgi:hypothetical protein